MYCKLIRILYNSTVSITARGLGQTLTRAISFITLPSQPIEYTVYYDNNNPGGSDIIISGGVGTKYISLPYSDSSQELRLIFLTLTTELIYGSTMKRSAHGMPVTHGMVLTGQLILRVLLSVQTEGLSVRVQKWCAGGCGFRITITAYYD